MSDDREITSTKNPIVLRFREAGVGEPPEVLVAEGVKLVWEALGADLPVVEAAVTERLRGSELGREVLRRLERSAPELHWCSSSVMERLSWVRTPPGVTAIFRRPALLPGDLLGRDRTPLLVVAAGVRDPGNLGSLVRAAEAAGATGLVALKGGADPYREKAVRGAAGSLFRLPVLSGWSGEQLCRLCEEHGLQLVVADGRGTSSYLEADFTKPTALVVGAETGGVPEELLAAADAHLCIPMEPTVESLNVAVAAGIVLFEARRQRR